MGRGFDLTKLFRLQNFDTRCRQKSRHNKNKATRPCRQGSREKSSLRLDRSAPLSHRHGQGILENSRFQPWASNAVSSGCRMSASRPSSTRSPRRRPRRRRTIRSARSSRTPAKSRFPIARMQKLANIAKSKEIIPTRISFVDIAGLVRGASKGEGLGNQFLANIREVDAIVHVLRCFEDDDITHVEGRINPVADAETIETELMLADLDSLERRTEQTRKRATGKDKDSMAMLPIMEASLKLLQDGKPVRTLLSKLDAEETDILQGPQPSDLASGSLRLQRRRRRCRRPATSIPRPSTRWPRHRVPKPSPSRPRSNPKSPSCRTKKPRNSSRALGLEEAGLDRLIRAGYKLLAPHHLFHGRPEGNARLDDRARHQGAAGRRRHPLRFRTRLHPRQHHRL